MHIITQIALWLSIIGAINWGLVGALNLNAVTALFGEASMLSSLIYILVGISGLWLIIDMFVNPPLTEQKR